MPDIIQKTVIRIRREEIADLHWSVPCWELHASAPFNQGMVRHGAVTSVQNPRNPTGIDVKPEYFRHVEDYLRSKNDPEGAKARPLLVWGARNTFQNLGLPGWQRNRTPRLLQRPDEPCRHWVYQGLCKFTDGSLAIAALKFHSRADCSQESEVVFETNQFQTRTAEWVITGQPLLWDGEVPPIDLLAACTYDLRHIWHLQWEAWQNCTHDQIIHTELMAAFMDNLIKPVQERAAILSAIANRHGLAIADSYLHSSIGIRPNGELILVVQHGSLTELGYTHKSLGADRAILLDNGGSVGIAFWSKRAWLDKGWQKVKNNPVYLGNGSYFRPKGHSVLVAELTEDFIDKPFAPRPSAISPWLGRFIAED